jgi:hypothetical protein
VPTSEITGELPEIIGTAIGFSGMKMERYNFPVKIVVLNNGGIGPGMPEIPDNPMFNMKPNSLIYGARYDRMMDAFGGKGFLCRGPARPEGRSRRGDELPRPGIGQRRDLVGFGPQAAAIPLAQLTGLYLKQ